MVSGTIDKVVSVFRTNIIKDYSKAKRLGNGYESRKETETTKNKNKTNLKTTQLKYKKFFQTKKRQLIN